MLITYIYEGRYDMEDLNKREILLLPTTLSVLQDVQNLHPIYKDSEGFWNSTSFNVSISHYNFQRTTAHMDSVLSQ